jgi:putative transcriptional regulator
MKDEEEFDSLENKKPTLRGALLLAEPTMRDVNFSRAVILLTQHSELQGAHGYVLNRPLDQTVGDFLSGGAFDSLSEVPVYLGGPVDQQRLSFMALAWNETEKVLAYESQLSAPVAKKRLQQGKDVRAFIGYSGWTAGQLENELERQTWVITRPGKQIVEVKKPEKLWEATLTSMGPVFQLMAKMPEEVDNN